MLNGVKMAHISPLEQNLASIPEIVQKNKEKVYEDRDPLVLKGMVKLLQYRRLSKYIQIVFVGLHVGMLIYSTQGKFRYMYDTLNVDRAVVKFIDTLGNFLLTVTNIFGFISLFRSVELYDLIFDVKRKSFNTEHGNRRFQHGMIILNVLNCVTLLAIGYVFTLIGWDHYRCLIARDLEFYSFNLNMYIVLCFVHKIKENFHDVNQLLLEIDQEFLVSDPNHTSHGGNGKSNVNGEESPKLLERLKSITQYHNSICNLLDKYNDCFKTVLVLIVLCMIVTMLWDFTFMIEFAITPRSINGININVYVSIVNPLLVVITTGQAALAALVGEHLSYEGQKTTVLCYSLLNKFPIRLETDNAKLMEKQINLLLDQSRTRNVSLHAGGFFKLDWGILGSIASTVATYSIVIIQFLMK